MAGIFEVTRYSVDTLRSVTVLLNAAAMGLLCTAIHRLWNDRVTTMLAAALFASLPLFAAYGRMGTEVTGVIPFLLAAAGYIGVRARTNSQYGVWLRMGAGVLVGMAAFTHVIALSVPMALVFLVLIPALSNPARLMRWWPFVIGAVLAFAPRIISLLATSSDSLPGGNVFIFHPRFADLHVWKMPE